MSYFSPNSTRLGKNKIHSIESGCLCFTSEANIESSIALFYYEEATTMRDMLHSRQETAQRVAVFGHSLIEA